MKQKWIRKNWTILLVLAVCFSQSIGSSQASPSLSAEEIAFFRNLLET
jgi:hypothetical protein